MRVPLPTLLTVAFLVLGATAVLPSATAAPAVTTIVPSSGSENGGTNITINGSGFTDGATVCLQDAAWNPSVGCAAADVARQVVITPTKISAVTPPRTSPTVGSSGLAVNVIVSNLDGQTTIVTDGFNFVNKAAPTITSFSPVTGSSNGGTQVTIKGTNFEPNARPTVLFDSVEAPVVTVVDSTTLRVTTPAHTGNDGADVTVTYPSGSDVESNGFFYALAPAPTVGELSPSSGGTNGGTQVSITGTGFAPGATVEFVGSSSVPGTRAFVESPTKIIVLSPPLKTLADSTGVSIRVINPDGQDGEKGSAYTYRSSAAPSVTEMAPVSGPEYGGQVVAISGANFVGGTVLCASDPGTSGTCPSLDLVEPTEVPNAEGALCPANACFPMPPDTGVEDFWILNPDGKSAEVPDSFTYVESTRVTSLNKTSGSSHGGTAVRILGENFVCESDGIEAVVEFGGTPVFKTVLCDDGFIDVITPGHLAGTVDVRVRSANGLVAVYHKAFQFESAATPALTTVSPTSGGANGGTEVTLGGSGFGCPSTALTGSALLTRPLPTVTFGTKAVSGLNITSCSSTSIKVLAPAQTALPNLAVKVQNPNGGTPAQKTSAFSYTSEAPSITSMSAHAGPANGATNVTITGTGFVCDDALGRMAAVKFGSNPAARVTPGTCVKDPVRDVWTTTTLYAVSPGKGAGALAAPVRVTNPSGEASTDTSADDFTYAALADPPSVNELSASSGPTLGGGLLTITGTDFACPADGPQSRVFFKAASGDTGIEVHRDDVDCDAGGESIDVKVPPHVQGLVNVLVTNPDGQTDTLTGGFSYNVVDAGPSIQSLGITKATVLGGSALRITSNSASFYCNPLGPNAAVQIGSTKVPASDVTIETCTSGRTTTLIVKTPARTSAVLEPVIVINPDLQQGSVGGGLQYLDVPSLTKVTPSSGSYGGGPVVKLEGSNLLPGGSTLFGDLAAPISAGAGSTAAVKTPSTDVESTPAVEKVAGAVDVAFIDPSGQSATLANGYTYTPPVVPVASTISPDAGAVSGGTEVTITGANFLAGATVCFAPLVAGECLDDFSVPATVSSSTQLKALTPPHSLGTVDVTVINADGQPGLAMVQAFTFLGQDQLPVPTITSVQPSSGPAAGGTVVTINGTNLASSAKVKFGLVEATNLQFVNPQQVKVTTPAHDPGAVDVTVTVGTQSSLPKVAAFTYLGNTTTDPDPGNGTGNDSDSDSDSDSDTGGTGALTPAAIKNANDRIDVTVTRDGDDNVITWDLPSPPAGQTIMGVQVWRSNSPYTLVQTIPSSSDAFEDSTFRDTSSEARATSKYLVTMYYGATSALGLFTASSAPDTDDYPGFASVDGDSDGGASGLPTWAIVLIALGILFLVVLIAVLIARGRNREGQQGAAQGYAWQEEGEAKAAEGEWQPPAEVHQARCPACATSFTATGQKPIVTVCPGCGKKGILR